MDRRPLLGSSSLTAEPSTENPGPGPVPRGVPAGRAAWSLSATQPANVSKYRIEAINGAVILFALVLARIVGGESTAEER